MTQLETPTESSRDNPGDPGTLLFENDRVRIWELVMKPGEVCNWHQHDLDHLLVVFDGSAIGAESADGETNTVDIPDRKVIFVPRGKEPELAWNPGPDRVLRELIIDIKDGGAADPEREGGFFSFFDSGTATTTRPM